MSPYIEFGLMNAHQQFRKTQEREFFAHHMLLHAAELEIEEAQKSQVGRFNKCLVAMVMSSLAIEALANAVGSRVASDWPAFERMSPLEKIDFLVGQLSIVYDAESHPWQTVRYLAGFRNDIAHPKPELLQEEQVLPEVALGKTLFDSPQSKLEREITLGNACRAHTAVSTLKRILAYSLPPEKQLGIYCDSWSGSTGAVE